MPMARPVIILEVLWVGAMGTGAGAHVYNLSWGAER